MSIPSFHNTPILAGRPASLVEFSRIYDSAFNSFQRIAIFGDSQETLGGAGTDYIDSLNVFANERFGQAPQTPLYPPGLNFSSGNPPGRFLGRGVRNGGSSVPATYSPPNFSGYRTAEAINGVVHVLCPNGEGMTSYENYRQFFDPTTEDIIFRVFCRTKSTGSAEIIVQERHRNISLPNFGSTLFATNTSSGLNLNGSDNDIVFYDTPTLTYDPDNPFFQMRIRGVDLGGGEQAELVGTQFIDTTAPDRGMIFQSFSGGGDDTTDLLSDHSLAGAGLRAYDTATPFSVIFLTYSANDIGATPEAYRTRVETLITALRGPDWFNRPVLIGLVSDDYRENLSTVEESRYNQFARIHAEIATRTDNTVAVNLGRLTSELAWPQSWNNVASDGIHVERRFRTQKAALFLDTWRDARRS